MPGIPENPSSASRGFDSSQTPPPASAQLLAILANPLTQMPEHFEPAPAHFEPIEEIQAPIPPAHAAKAQTNLFLKKSLRTISSFSGIALGIMSAFAIGGVMATPVGWGIVGGLLAFALIGSLLCGGPEEFKKSLTAAVLGIVGGLAGGLTWALTLPTWAFWVMTISGSLSTAFSVCLARFGSLNPFNPQI